MEDMKKIRELYLPPTDGFVVVDVPVLRYFMVDGTGPVDADVVRFLWAAVHPIKVRAKERMGPRFVHPPLEGLFWADDMEDLVAMRDPATADASKLKWRMMIPTPDWADDAMFANGIEEASKRLGSAPAGLRVDTYDEGTSVQIMYVGPPEDCGDLLTDMHEVFLPEHGLIAHGPHHEIYLCDTSRTPPAKHKMVLRQPVCDGA